jgi:hypothetical protein
MSSKDIRRFVKDVPSQLFRFSRERYDFIEHCWMTSEWRFLNDDGAVVDEGIDVNGFRERLIVSSLSLR